MPERIPEEWLVDGGPLEDDERADQDWCTEARELLEKEPWRALSALLQDDEQLLQDVKGLGASLKKMGGTVRVRMEEQAEQFLQDQAALLGDVDNEFLRLTVGAVLDAWELTEGQRKQSLPMLDPEALAGLFRALVDGVLEPFLELDPGTWVTGLLETSPGGRRAALEGDTLRTVEPYALLGAAVRKTLGGDGPSLSGRLLLTALAIRASVDDEDGYPYKNKLGPLGLDPETVADGYRALLRGDFSCLLGDDAEPDDFDKALAVADRYLGKMGLAIDGRQLAVRARLQAADIPADDLWVRLTLRRLETDSEFFEHALAGLEQIATRAGVALDMSEGTGLEDARLWGRPEHVDLWFGPSQAEVAKSTFEEDLQRLSGQPSALGQLHAALLYHILTTPDRACMFASELGLSELGVNKVEQAFREGDARVLEEGLGEAAPSVLASVLQLGPQGLHAKNVNDPEAVHSDVLHFVADRLEVSPGRHWLLAAALARGLRQADPGHSGDAFDIWMHQTGIAAAAIAGDASPFEQISEDQLLTLAESITAASGTDENIHASARTTMRGILTERAEAIQEDDQGVTPDLEQELRSLIETALEDPFQSGPAILALRAGDAVFFRNKLRRAEREKQRRRASNAGPRVPSRKEARARAAWNRVSAISVCGSIFLITLIWVGMVYLPDRSHNVRSDSSSLPPPRATAIAPQDLGLLPVTLAGQQGWIGARPVDSGAYADLSPSAVVDLLTRQEPAHTTYGEALRWCEDYDRIVRQAHSHLFADDGPLAGTRARLAHRGEHQIATALSEFEEVGLEWLLTPGTNIGWGTPIEVAPGDQGRARTASDVGFRVLFAPSLEGER